MLKAVSSLFYLVNISHFLDLLCFAVFTVIDDEVVAMSLLTCEYVLMVFRHITNIQPITESFPLLNALFSILAQNKNI